MIDSNRQKTLSANYLGIGTDWQDYPSPDKWGYAESVRERFTNVRMDLESYANGEEACLVNHGYALTDAAIRGYVPELVRVSSPLYLPYPSFADPKKAFQSLVRSHSRGVLFDAAAAIANKVRSKLPRLEGGLYR